MTLRCLLRPIRLLFQCTGVVFPCLFAALPVDAQPSSGPHGPIQQRYELPQAAHIFYVAPNGNAKAPGSSLEQPTTLKSAISKVVTGDAIVLRGGTYRTGGLELNQGITMQPYADEQPILKGTEVATEWEAQPNGLWRTSWKRLFPAKPADWWRGEWNVRRTPLHLFNNDMVFIDGKFLDAVGTAEDVYAGAYYIDYENGFIYIGTDPANRVVEITAQNRALHRTIRDVHGKQNDRKGPTIRGLTFTQYARLALEVEGTEPGEYTDPANFGKEVVGTTLENLTISFCSRVAGYFRGDGLVIRNCLVSDCGTEGIYVIDSADVLLEGNIVTRTNSAEQLTGYFASAIKIFNQSYRAICRDNVVTDNPHATGIWYDVGNVDGIFINNWIERTDNGFFFEISKGAICAGNVFVNCSPGIRILNSSHVQVYQNTFFNSAAQFSRSARSSEAGDHFGWHASSGPAVDDREGHVFANNLLVADQTFGEAFAQFTQNEQLRGRMTEPHVDMMDGNVYVRTVHFRPLPLITWGPVETEGGTKELFSIDQLHELHPEFEVNAQAFDYYRGPLFNDADSKNFALLKSFPGAYAGVPLPDHISETLGWEPGEKVFPGAYAPR